MRVDLPSVPGANPRWWWGVVAAAVLFLVSGVSVYLFRHSAVPEKAKLPGESPELVLQQMAVVREPPAFIPSAAGAGKTDRSEEKFKEGMREYSAGNYSEAILLLEEALQTNPGNMAATFYLGVSFLITDQPDKAVAELSKLAIAHNSYAHESHWYSAKAHFKKRDLAAARRELEAVIASDGIYAAEARKALQKINSLR